MGFRGITDCGLNGLSYECDGTRNKDGYLCLKERSYLLGTANILIPSVDYQYFFCAPTLIYHYVEINNYLPPEEFIEAVLNFDFTRPFNALEIYENIGY
ncbi:hypothetical protein VQ643_15955 [Pseudomonas sp. F1_0610]|uniref:DUF7919 family protein n=1 Tax=Pseudomonas sp. F1_0610 TaxID=3114284 RepID=UPI0039C4505B